MKKAYVKPIMESEAFVANEYVAACGTITCTSSKGSCGSITWKENYPSGLNLYENSGQGTFIGKIGESNGCTTKATWNDYKFEDLGDWLKFLNDLFNGNLQTETAYHPVSVSDDGYFVGDTFHPNVSV